MQAKQQVIPQQTWTCRSPPLVRWLMATRFPSQRMTPSLTALPRTHTTARQIPQQTWTYPSQPRVR
jgi:hypothetical protein